MNHLPKKSALKSLIIGLQSNETNFGFWEETFKDLPLLSGMDNVTIIYNYPRVKVFDTDCWEYFDGILIRRDLFPALKKVHVWDSSGSQQLSSRRWWATHGSPYSKLEGTWLCKFPAFRRPFN